MSCVRARAILRLALQQIKLGICIVVGCSMARSIWSCSSCKNATLDWNRAVARPVGRGKIYLVRPYHLVLSSGPFVNHLISWWWRWRNDLASSTRWWASRSRFKTPFLLFILFDVRSFTNIRVLVGDGWHTNMWMLYWPRDRNKAGKRESHTICQLYVNSLVYFLFLYRIFDDLY